VVDGAGGGAVGLLGCARPALGAGDAVDSLAPTPSGRSMNARQPWAASSTPAGTRAAAAQAAANVAILRFALSWRSRRWLLPSSRATFWSGGTRSGLAVRSIVFALVGPDIDRQSSTGCWTKAAVPTRASSRKNGA